MYTPSFAALALLAGSVAARTCMNATIPVEISARQGLFTWKVPETNMDVTEFALNVTQQGRNFTAAALGGYQTTSGRYNISTQFCMPSNMSFSNLTSPTVQVLTHGIGFDKTYWDLSYNNYTYSYISVATDQYGYCTLSFDRLGVGNSSHGQALNEIQSFIEVAATVSLTQMLRNGTFPGVNHTFSRVVHVGHSFGSAQTYALANNYPNITDGIVLTGFTTNTSFAGYFVAGGNFQLAARNQPLRFANITDAQVQTLLGTYAEALGTYIAPIDVTSLPPSQMLPPGYLLPSSAEAVSYNFFKPQYFDPAILTLADRTKQPVTGGEILTLGSIPTTNNFAGPVLAISGDADLPYCGGNCTNTGTTAQSLMAEVKTAFPRVADNNFTAYTQPNTGHGINLHYNATGAYRVINDFLNSHGLQSR